MFHKGDRVKIKNDRRIVTDYKENWNDDIRKTFGKTGEIICIDSDDGTFPFLVRFTNEEWWYPKSALEPANDSFVKPMKITIETDGYHMTTAEYDGHKGVSKCNPDDKFRLSKGIALAVSRMLEDTTDDDSELRVGDIVEILEPVGCGDDIVGLQGVIKSIHNDTYSVLPVDRGERAFLAEHLKLIRRGKH